MTDRIIYKVVSKGGGVDGRDASDKGGKVIFASFDREEAEKKVNGWYELKAEVIEHYEKHVDRLVKHLDPVDVLILTEYFS